MPRKEEEKQERKNSAFVTPPCDRAGPGGTSGCDPPCGELSRQKQKTKKTKTQKKKKKNNQQKKTTNDLGGVTNQKRSAPKKNFPAKPQPKNNQQ